MVTIRTIHAKDVSPEEIAQVRSALADIPLFSPLRMFIRDLLVGLESGLDMTLIAEAPEKNSDTV